MLKNRLGNHHVGVVLLRFFFPFVQLPVFALGITCTVPAGLDGSLARGLRHQPLPRRCQAGAAWSGRSKHRSAEKLNYVAGLSLAGFNKPLNLSIVWCLVLVSNLTRSGGREKKTK